MRQLYLVNEVGFTYFLDYRNSTLISRINDLGIEKENTYLSYKDTYVKVDEKNPQKELQFDVVFLKGYKGYEEFIKFIRESNELRLFYKIGDEVKFAYVSFKSITKTELQSYTIQSTLVLDKLSLWINKVNYTVKVNVDSNGKVFPFPYPFTYSSSFNGEIVIRNDGEVKAPLNIRISGAVNKPRIDILRDGIVVTSMHLMVISSDCTIEVNSEESNQYMKMVEDGTERNIYQEQDFTCDNFLFIDKGEYVLKFIPGVNSKTECTIQLQEGYGGH